jgi:hypothetical protein
MRGESGYSRGIGQRVKRGLVIGLSFHFVFPLARHACVFFERRGKENPECPVRKMEDKLGA